MEIKDKISLSKVRLEYAKEALKDAENLLKVKSYKASANRSYYAIFHSMRAVLALDGIDLKHHSGVISEFRRLYIKTKNFPTEMSDIITKLFKIRSDSDYKDFYILPKQDVRDQFANAGYFIKETEKFLKKRYKEILRKC